MESVIFTMVLDRKMLGYSQKSVNDEDETLEYIFMHYKSVAY